MNHDNFILSPIHEYLKDVVSASICIGSGIETYPLCDYVMQSVFLKMTGAQEQKMKCICWELATIDYEYRYMKFSQNRLGQCSSYKEKKSVYKDLISQINSNRLISFNVNSIDREAILEETISSIKSIFIGSNLLIWAQKKYDEYVELWSNISVRYFATDNNNLFSEVNDGYSLKKIYENHLYRQRNRIAHNTLSYQQNLPTFETLINSNYKYNNYFIYFSILILIDYIFMAIYKQFLQTIEDF